MSSPRLVIVRSSRSNLMSDSARMTWLLAAVRRLDSAVLPRAKHPNAAMAVSDEVRKLFDITRLKNDWVLRDRVGPRWNIAHSHVSLAILLTGWKSLGGPPNVSQSADTVAEGVHNRCTQASSWATRSAPGSTS